MGVIHTVHSGTRIENEIEIKRSRFITTLARTDSPDEARALINEVKADNPQARHNCSAFLIQVDGRDPHQHSSDDGEPSGTAGTPMIDALRLAGVWNVTAVVTRYFGGILLGGGGLVRAYSSSVSKALTLAPKAKLVPLDALETRVSLAQAGRVEAELRNAGAQILGIDWGSEATIRIGTLPDSRAIFEAQILALTSGVSQFQMMGTTRVEVDE